MKKEILIDALSSAEFSNNRARVILHEKFLTNMWTKKQHDKKKSIIISKIINYI